MSQLIFRVEIIVIIPFLLISVLCISCENSVDSEEIIQTPRYNQIPEALTINHLDLLFEQVKDSPTTVTEK